MTQEQLEFGFDQMAEEQRTAHLPSTMEEGVPYFRGLIERYNSALLAGDAETARTINNEAHDLAVKLNNGEPGILANPDSPGYVLERLTAAEPGTIPKWGQAGDFTIDIDGMKVRIEQDGIFGLGFSLYPGFAVHAVDYDKPFLSDTGYRSFIGCNAEIAPGRTPDSVASDMCRAYIQEQCKGKSRKIERSYVEREMARRQTSQRQQGL
jgi:hypothetical protein